MRRLLRSPLILTLWFTVMLLAFAVVGAPAFVLDDALAQASDGRIRLSASSGTLWRGAGLLVEREGGRYRPWIDIAWRVDLGELWRGRLGLALTIDGELATQLTVAPDGFGIDLPGASLPLAPLVRILPHPTARLGWNGRLHASGELVHCTWHITCEGRLRLDIDALSLSVLPDAQLGRYRLDASTGADGLQLTLTDDGNNRLTARGAIKVLTAGRSKGEITLSGERDLVRQISAMTSDISKITPEGTLGIDW